MEFRPPSYNRSVTYSIAAFYDHSLQSIMALFIAKTPSLGTDLSSCLPDERQDYFFYRFRIFADAYVNLALDDDIYFSSTSKDKAGVSRVGKFFAEKDKQQQSYQAEKIKYFEQKFNCHISGEKDERLFLGVRQIWNRIAIDGDELLRPYMSEVASAYDDDSFSTPIPNKLDRYLVPLKLRSKVYHKWSNRRRIVPVTSREYEESDVPECKRKEPNVTIQTVLLGDED